MKIKIVSQDIWIDINFLVGLAWGVECKVSREEAELLVLAIEEALENEFDCNSEDYPSEFDENGRRILTMPPHAFITRVEGVATDTLHIYVIGCVISLPIYVAVKLKSHLKIALEESAAARANGEEVLRYEAMIEEPSSV